MGTNMNKRLIFRIILFPTLLMVGLISAYFFYDKGRLHNAKIIMASDSSNNANVIINKKIPVNGFGTGQRKIWDNFSEIPLKYAGGESVHLKGADIEAVRSISYTSLYFLLRDHLVEQGIDPKIYNDHFSDYESLLARATIERTKSRQNILRSFFNNQSANKINYTKTKFQEFKIEEANKVAKIFGTKKIDIEGSSIEVVSFALHIAEEFYMTGVMYVPKDIRKNKIGENIIYLSLPGCGESALGGVIQNRMTQAALAGMVGIHIEMFCRNGMMTHPDNSKFTRQLARSFGLKNSMLSIESAMFQAVQNFAYQKLNSKDLSFYVTGWSTSLPTVNFLWDEFEQVKGKIFIGGEAKKYISCDNGNTKGKKQKSLIKRVSPGYWYEYYPAYDSGTNTGFAGPGCDTISKKSAFYILGLSDPQTRKAPFFENAPDNFQKNKIYSYLSNKNAEFVFVKGNHNHDNSRSEMAINWIIEKESLFVSEKKRELLKTFRHEDPFSKEDLFQGFDQWIEDKDTLLTLTKKVTLKSLNERQIKNFKDREQYLNFARQEMKLDYWNQSSDGTEPLTIGYGQESFKINNKTLNIIYLDIPINSEIATPAILITPPTTKSFENIELWGSTRHILPKEDQLISIIEKGNPTLIYNLPGFGLASDRYYSVAQLNRLMLNHSEVSVLGLAAASTEKVISFLNDELCYEHDHCKITLHLDGIIESLYGYMVGSIFEEIRKVEIRNGIVSLNDFINKPKGSISTIFLQVGNFFTDLNIEAIKSYSGDTEYELISEADTEDFKLFGPF